MNQIKCSQTLKQNIAITLLLDVMKVIGGGIPLHVYRWGMSQIKEQFNNLFSLTLIIIQGYKKGMTVMIDS